MEEGIILKGIGGFYDVQSAHGVFQCKARGKFRRMGITPMVGDRVRFSPQDCAIEEILPRKNELLRPPVANIDYLGVVMAVKHPDPDFLLVDKLLVYAGMLKIRPIIIINKVDLDEGETLNHIEAMYAKSGYPIIRTSSLDSQGVEELKDALKDGIVSLAGQSGVGKSSLINSLYPHLSLETGQISSKVKRGRHTTRHVELLSLPNQVMLVDTPGFSSMEVIELKMEELQDYYPEFQPYRHECRFAGCFHHHEPQCRVKEMVKNGAVPEERYLRYIRLLDEIRESRRDEW